MNTFKATFLGRWRAVPNAAAWLAVATIWAAAGTASAATDFRYSLVIRSSASTKDTGTLPSSDASLSCTEPFYVEYWARDEGSRNTGVTCAYLDLRYDPDRVQVLNIEHTTEFDRDPFASGDDDKAGRIDELGGCSLPGADPVGIAPDWACVARVKMMPISSGCAGACGGTGLNLTSQSASNESSAYHRGKVPPGNIAYGDASASLNCTCLYDMNADCAVNGVDLGLMAPGWRKCAGDTGYIPAADFDCSGCFAGGDIAFFATAWTRPCNDARLGFADCKGCGSSGLLAPGSSLVGGAREVQFALRLVDTLSTVDQLDGDPPGGLTSIAAGQNVFAEFWARDLNPASEGLVSAFADLGYSPQQFRLVNTQTYSGFGLLTGETPQPGRLKAWGGATLLRGLGAGHWVRVASAEMEGLVDTDAPEIWLQPDDLDPAARYGVGALPAARIETLQAVAIFGLADFDRDGDVDQADFGLLQPCLFAEPAALDPTCLHADLNRDTHIDLGDVLVFQQCANGPEIPADVGCGR